MTHSYDWLVVGGGITGATLGYELTKQGYSVLLLEKNSLPDNATYYSYGGLAYWSSTSPLTNQICDEGIELHRRLSEELKADTEFRDIDFLLTISTEENPQKLAATYAQSGITYRLVDATEASEIEPLLNRKALSGALLLPGGHIHPGKTTQAYWQAYQRLGGKIEFAQVLSLLKSGETITGVKTTHQNYYAAHTVVCAGGFSRALLQATGINAPVYFTHAELIKTPPIQDLQLRSLVMPANLGRFQMEDNSCDLPTDDWLNTTSDEEKSAIMEPGAIQFVDGSFCLGQLSRIIANPYVQIDAASSEAKIRHGIGNILPDLENLPGTWHHCLVAFGSNSLPVVGEIGNMAGLYLFSGFTATMLFAPPLARHFARWVSGQEDELIEQIRI